MTKITIDFRFTELEYELWALDQYRKTLEEQIEYLSAQKELQAKARFGTAGLTPDDVDYDLAMQEVSELVDGVVPRFYRGPFLVALWGIFESAVEEIAKYIAEKKNVPLRLRDISGRTPKERWSKYFDHVLDYDLRIDPLSWERLDKLRILRNAVAHCNGRISLLNQDVAAKINKWVKEDEEICIDLDFLVVSRAYAQEATDLVRVTLSEIVDRVKQDFLSD